TRSEGRLVGGAFSLSVFQGFGLPFFSLRRRLRLKLGLVALVVTALLPLAALFFSEPICRVENAIAKADAIVVLGGEAQHRPQRALELYRQGAAPVIIISGAGDWPEART